MERLRMGGDRETKKQCICEPLGRGLYASLHSCNRLGALLWRVSGKVFSFEDHSFNVQDRIARKVDLDAKRERERESCAILLSGGDRWQ